MASIALVGCSSDSDGDDGMQGGQDGGGDPVVVSDDGNYAVARNDGTNPGSVHLFSGGLDGDVTVLETGRNQGIAFDGQGNLYQNGDSDDATGLTAFATAEARMTGDAFDTARDREMSVAPGKGLAYVASAGLLVSGDVSDESADLKVFASTAGEGAAPIATVDMPAPVWDTFHDPEDDRLFAALTDGTLAIFDDFSDDPSARPDRLVTPVDDAGMPVSINFHGVFVADGTILVSDVGDAMSASDGALFVFSDDDDLNGEVTAFTRIAGATTLLGNPVDVILDNGAAIVAEKSNDLLLTFADVASSSGGDIAPDAATAFTKPESIALTAASSMQADVSDLDVETDVESVAVAQNPSAEQIVGVDATLNADVGVINLLEADLESSTRFSAALVEGDPGAQSFRTLENIQYDGEGNLYAVVDTTDGDSVSSRGIVVLHRPGARADGVLSMGDRDRVISGSDVGLTSPKGIEVVQSLGLLIVADVGGEGVAGTLDVFSQNAGGNAAPLFTVTAVGDGAIWDIDYDPAEDRLYAAGTVGDILVYDDFVASGASASPTRTIRPSTAMATSNIHGIVHVAASDQLIATDVGSAASAEDGSLYVIDGASTVEGSVDPVVTIAGPATQLGNPVDIAFDGADVYIAEKSNDQLLVYTDVLSLQGTLDTAADVSVVQSKPESVSLLPE